MSGDSSNSHTNDIFDFKDGRISPAPTTSKDISVQGGSSVVAASVLVEPNKDIEKPDELVPNSPASIIGEVENDFASAERTLPLNENQDSGDADPSNNKQNGLDKLDGQWIHPKDEKGTQQPQEEENCTVKCLYYTLQCCECTIM